MKRTSSGTLKEGDFRSPPSKSDRILFLFVLFRYSGESGKREFVNQREHHWYIGELTGASSSSFTHLCMMPIDAPFAGTPVVLGSSIYYIGGCFSRGRDRFYSSKVYVFDTLNPNKGWNQVRSMHVPRKAPFAIAVDGKIYVFGGHTYFEKCPFGEVFDTVSGTWEVLIDPPVNYTSASPIPSITNRYVPSTVNGLIPVHLGEQFYGYSVDDQSWVPMDYLDNDEFYLCEPAVFMDDVVYMYKPRSDCALGYNFVKKKFSTVTFDGQFPDPTICFAQPLTRRLYKHFLVSLSDRNLCLISWDEISKISVKKFEMGKSQCQGDIETLSARMDCSTTFNVVEGEGWLQHVISVSGSCSTVFVESKLREAQDSRQIQEENQTIGGRLDSVENELKMLRELVQSLLRGTPNPTSPQAG